MIFRARFGTFRLTLSCAWKYRIKVQYWNISKKLYSEKIRCFSTGQRFYWKFDISAVLLKLRYFSDLTESSIFQQSHWKFDILTVLLKVWYFQRVFRAPRAWERFFFQRDKMNFYIFDEAWKINSYFFNKNGLFTSKVSPSGFSV